MSPANEIAAVVLQRFFLQFFTASGGTGAPATRTDSKASPSFWQRVPRGGTRCQKDRSVRYGAQGTKTNNRPSNIHHFPSPVPHPHHHHHSPCQPPPTTFLQVLDHPHSKLGVGGQAPTTTSHPPGGWPKTRVFKPKIGGVGPSPTPPKPDIHNTSKHDTRPTPSPHTQSPFIYATATGAHLSAVKCSKARGKHGDRPEEPTFGWPSESCLPKKTPKTSTR